MLDKIVLDPHRHVLIMFYVPWCPHCQKALLEFDVVADAFAAVPTLNVTVAILDADKHKDAARTYGGTHRYPTIEFFPKGNKNGFVPWVYLAPPSADHLISYVNELAHSDVQICGSVGPAAAVEASFEPSVRSAWKSRDFEQAALEIDASAKEHQRSNAQLYLQAFKKISQKGIKHVTAEITRLQNVLQQGGLSRDKKALFTMRLNVVQHIASLQQAE